MSKFCILSSVLELISSDVIAAAEMKQLILIQSGDSLMASHSAVRELGELLLDAEDRVDRARGLNLKSRTALQELQVMGNKALIGHVISDDTLFYLSSFSSILKLSWIKNKALSIL